MIDISVQNVKKAFEEGVDILSGISFEIFEGEHVGLLGKNGAGKTTVFRMITGGLTPDEGVIVVPGFKKTGLISQIPEYPPEFSSEDVLRTAFSRLIGIKSEMERLETSMSQGHSRSVLEEYDKLAYEFERSGGYSMEFELSRVANGLQIPERQMKQRFDTLSGGEKTRINLARLILENTDILLLDEPTNHLDMRATEWLEEYIGKYRGTVLIISHDRYFLDRTISRAIEIDAGKAVFYSGNYSYYVQEKKRRYLEQLEKYEREQVEAKRLRDAADRLYQWGTGNKNLMKKSFAIQKRAERVIQTERPTGEKRIGARFGEKDFFGDEVVVIKKLSKAFEGKTLINIDELEIRGGERIALIGDNGSGKSTLIKLITGELKPDSGAVRRGPSVKTAYLPQIIKFNNPYRSILDTLVYEDNCSPQTARNRLGAFKFSGDDVFKSVGNLSGGEKSRLRLCILMNEDINLLILDEPTNHLDITSREWIESAVGEYEGTLLFVSHDRYFIEKFATRVWELGGGVLTDFNGTFSEYRAFKASSASSAAKAVRTVRKEAQKKKPASPQKELKKLEREIETIEAKLDELSELKDEFATDYVKLMELDAQESGLYEELEAKYAEWEIFENL